VSNLAGSTQQSRRDGVKVAQDVQSWVGLTNESSPEGTAELIPHIFQPSLRDWISFVYPTQHCVLGYSQASLRD
jgi:hypothetical protein